MFYIYAAKGGQLCTDFARRKVYLLEGNSRVITSPQLGCVNLISGCNDPRNEIMVGWHRVKD